GKLLNFVPTLFTFGLLAAVGFFGHHFGWKMPKASELRVTTVAEKKPNWCSEHNVPEDQCVDCNKKLLEFCEKPRWCKEHGVSECPTHHPELAQVAGEPKLPQYDTVAAINLFDRPENNSRCNRFLRRIQYESAEVFEKMGIDVDVVTERPMIEALRINGELGYDQSQVAHLSTRSAGSVFKVFKMLGDEVQAGDVLALVDAAEVGKAKSQLGHAAVQLQLKKRTVESLRSSAGVIPERQLREAEAAYEEAQIGMTMATQALVNLGFEVPGGLTKLDAERLTRTLQCLGLPDELCEKLSAKGSMTMNLIPIVAPQDGVIVEMDVVAGEVVQPEKTLLTLANLSRVWLTLHVKQEDSERLSLGQKVKFKADGGKREVAGRLSFISPSVDESTRTIKVRAVLGNQDRVLKANSFGAGWIVLREEPKAVTVPLDAVQSDGDCQIVFVRDKNFLKKDSPKVFHARQVRVGAKTDTHVELLAGALPGEVVATKGSASFRAELLKTGFGEGCCGGHGHGGGHGHEH
ncbi:MAG TPA: efflux RND transporter periplasmic adaptor subunit, partial [Planctomycetaceae bacterium]|nr:efflux RND transporter periplasmic adaptor subunit [Planctomycetaceae bacterium]